jgi:hypothetical protein
MTATADEIEKARQQGQAEGMIGALREVRLMLDEGKPRGHADPNINTEFQAIWESISSLKKRKK